MSGCVWVSFFIDSIKKRFSSSEKISLSKNGVFYGFYFPPWSLRMKYCPVVLCLGQTKYVSILISISVFSMPWGVLLKKNVLNVFYTLWAFVVAAAFLSCSGVSQKKNNKFLWCVCIENTICCSYAWKFKYSYRKHLMTGYLCSLTLFSFCTFFVLFCSQGVSCRFVRPLYKNAGIFSNREGLC